MKKTSSILKNGRLIIFVVLIVLLTVTCPGMFLTYSNLVSVLLNVSLYGIMTCGMIYTALVSGPDLSVGGMAAVASAISVQIIVRMNYSNTGVLLGLLLSLAVAAVIGLLHGMIIYYLKAQSMLITLASKYVLFGVCQIITNSKIIACTSSKLFYFIGAGRFLGIAMPVYIFLLVAVLLGTVLTQTVYGRKIYAVGGNAKTAEICGIRPPAIIISSFVICSVCAALTGFLLAAFNQQATPVAGDGYEGEVLLCVVLGGIVMGEGIGKITGALYGVLLVGVMNNGMRLLGVPSMYQTLIKGALIIIAVAVDVYAINKKSGLMRKSTLFKKKNNAAKT